MKIGLEMPKASRKLLTAVRNMPSLFWSFEYARFWA